MSPRRRLAFTAIVVLALGSTACTEGIVGRLDGLDVARLLFGGPGGGMNEHVARMLGQSSSLGHTLVGAMMSLLGLWCGYQALCGRPWLPVLKELFIPTTFCLWVQSLSWSNFGLARLIYDGGIQLGERYAPPGGVFANWVLAILDSQKRPIMEAAAGGDPTTAFWRLSESIVMSISAPMIAAIVALNTMGVWLVKMMYHTWFALGFGLHVVLLPLFVVFVVYPPLRFIFTAFLKSMIAIALWPMFFGILESLLVALPMATYLGTGGGSGGVAWFTTMAQGQIFLFMLNWVFFVSMGLAASLSYGVMFGGPRIMAKIF